MDSSLDLYNFKTSLCIHEICSNMKTLDITRSLDWDNRGLANLDFFHPKCVAFRRRGGVERGRRVDTDDAPRGSAIECCPWEDVAGILRRA